MKLTPKPMDQLENDCITFIKSPKFVPEFLKCYKERAVKNITVITTEEVTQLLDIKANFIISNNPRLTFAKMVNDSLEKPKSFIHPSAVISKDVKMGENVTVHPNVVIYGDAIIGNNVTIHANTTVGKPGFGFVKDEENEIWIPFPQIAKVIIEDNVEIGSNNTVDRGALQDTIVGEGTKTDNLVHIAHGVQLGKNCIITAGVIFSGSVKVEDNVWIAPNVCIRENLTIGANSLLGLGTVVVKDVPEGSIIVGNPGKQYVKTDKK